MIKVSFYIILRIKITNVFRILKIIEAFYKFMLNKTYTKKNIYIQNLAIIIGLVYKLYRKCDILFEFFLDKSI